MPARPTGSSSVPCMSTRPCRSTCRRWSATSSLWHSECPSTEGQQEDSRRGTEDAESRASPPSFATSCLRVKIAKGVASGTVDPGFRRDDKLYAWAAFSHVSASRRESCGRADEKEQVSGLVPAPLVEDAGIG